MTERLREGLWPASDGRRFLAYIVDAVVVWAIIALTSIVVSSLLPKKDRRILDFVDGVPEFRIEPAAQPDWTPVTSIGTALLITGLIWGVFFVALRQWDTTLGKRLVRLGVIRPDGSELSVVRKAVRAAVQPFCIVFPGLTLVNGVMVLAGRLGRSLNDVAAGSVVVGSSPRSGSGNAGASWAD